MPLNTHNLCKFQSSLTVCRIAKIRNKPCLAFDTVSLLWPVPDLIPNLSRPPFNAHLDVLLPHAERSNYRPVLLRIDQLHLPIPHISEKLNEYNHSQSGRLTLNVLIKLGTNLYISLALIFFPRHRWFPAPK